MAAVIGLRAAKRVGVVALWLAAAFGAADAQVVNPADLQGQAPKATQNLVALGVDLMGDRINLFNGGIEFVHTDIALPGNDKLPVTLQRKHIAGRHAAIRGELGDWDLELPSIGGSFTHAQGWINGAAATNRCDNYSAPPGLSGASYGLWGHYYAEEFWQGNFLHVPGEPGREVLRRAAGSTRQPADGRSYPLLTQDGWAIRCLPHIANSSGQGFVALSPQGIEYQFDWMASRLLPSLGGMTGGIIPRREFRLFATRVSDRYGNSVSYQYDPANPWRLLRILSSDGRRIDLSYAAVAGGVRLVAASDTVRTWSYGYSAAGDLERVTLPDGSRWTMQLRGLVHPSPQALGDSALCDWPGAWPNETLTGTLTHPSGASGRFEARYALHPRHDVSRYCIVRTRPTYDGEFSPPQEYPMWPRETGSLTVARKTLSGPGIGELTWQFGYPSAFGSWYPCGGCSGSKIVTVTDPRGHQTRYTYGIRFQVNEGQLLQKDEGWNGSQALRSTSYSYAASGVWPEPVGQSPSATTDYLAARLRPVNLQRVTQQGATFSRTVWSDYWGRSERIHRLSSLGFESTRSIRYWDVPAKWVMGQTESVQEAAAEVERHDYDGMGHRIAAYSFGRLMARYAYAADGTLRVHYDAAGRATTYENYWRGTPRRLSHPDGTIELAAVDLLGRMTEHTNAAGTTHRFGYDLASRLTSVTYPSGDATAYHPTIHQYEFVAAPEFGLAPGHWRQTVSTGNSRSIFHYDALWRVRLAVKYDAVNPAATLRMVEQRWDVDGRRTFESIALPGVPAIDHVGTVGTSWVFDAIGRETQQRQDSEIGPLVTSTTYLAGFQRSRTSPRGSVSTFAHQAFDDPDDAHLIAAWLPEGVTMTFVRDAFGKPKSITRSGTYAGSAVSATRNYVYDLFHRLCKTVEPETAATVQQYDLAGNVTWRASGLALPNTSTCDSEAVPDARKVNYSYDARNRLTFTRFGDGGFNIMRTYTPDGLPWRIWSEGSVWTYTYNHRRLRVGESLNFDSVIYDFAYGIDAYGHLASMTYPGGPTLAYAPDALGQPTQVSGYAGNVTFHLDGSLARYTAANGVAFSMTQNVRGLAGRWQHAGVVDDIYQYDAAGNVSAISDGQQGLSTRTMAYDGLDRLIAADSVNTWGVGRFVYDPLDNLRGSTLGARALSHLVDPVTNRVSGLSGSLNVGLVYDANGNLVQRGTQGFVFDLGNRMRSAAGKATYRYDGLGRRTWIAYADGARRVQVYSGEGKLSLSVDSVSGTTRHIHLGDKLIAETNSLTGTSWVHTDVLGSPVARTSGSGVVVSRNRYEPYGATAWGSQPTGVGFTGHVNDPDTGLVYMQQRYYDPITARFLNLDPVVTDLQTGDYFNRYLYAANNPYRFIDPDGTDFVPSAGFGDACKATCNNIKKNIVQIVVCVICLANDKRPPPPPPKPPVPQKPVPGPPKPGGDPKPTGPKSPEPIPSHQSGPTGNPPPPAGSGGGTPSPGSPAPSPQPGPSTSSAPPPPPKPELPSN